MTNTTTLDQTIVEVTVSNRVRGGWNQTKELMTIASARQFRRETMHHTFDTLRPGGRKYCSVTGTLTEILAVNQD